MLFDEHGRTVTVICRALLRNPAEAEDAAQQTFLSAHRALLAGTVPREPAAWLATIARNECRARIRAHLREPARAEDVGAVPGTSDPVAEAIRQADLAALWAAIQALPKQQREALVLRELGGLSYDALADALTVSGAAVESLLFRARRRLRNTLRAAAAALTGLPWLETLAGGSAPVAAKVAVIGAGTAALAGGVVAPAALDERRPPRPPAHVQTHPAAVARVAPRQAVHRPAQAQAATVLAVVRRREPVAAPRRTERGDDRQAAAQTSREGSAAADGGSGSSSSGRDGVASGGRGPDNQVASVTVATSSVTVASTGSAASLVTGTSGSGGGADRSDDGGSGGSGSSGSGDDGGGHEGPG